MSMVPPKRREMMPVSLLLPEVVRLRTLSALILGAIGCVPHFLVIRVGSRSHLSAIGRSEKKATKL